MQNKNSEKKCFRQDKTKIVRTNMFQAGQDKNSDRKKSVLGSTRQK